MNDRSQVKMSGLFLREGEVGIACLAAWAALRLTHDGSRRNT
jgi:hypothetical protein